MGQLACLPVELPNELALDCHIDASVPDSAIGRPGDLNGDLGQVRRRRRNPSHDHRLLLAARDVFLRLVLLQQVLYDACR